MNDQDLIKLLDDLTKISVANTSHVSALNVIVDALVTTLSSEHQQLLLERLKIYSEALQDHPAMKPATASALQHVSDLLATPPDKPRPMLSVIQGGKSVS